MYLTIRRYENIKNPKEVEKRVKSGFIPMVSKMSGFVAYNFIDAGNGVMLSSSIFQDKASADASTQKAADWVKKELSDVITSKPQVTAGEILALTYADLGGKK